MSKLSSFWDYIEACIHGDRLMFIAITSSAEGKIPAEGFFYGQGKSSLAGGFSKGIYKQYHSLGDLESEQLSKDNMGYTWTHHVEAVRQAKEQRKLVYVMDDLQRIAGKSKSRNKEVQEWAEFFSTARPLFAIVIATCPDLGALAKCWRDIMMFEIKIPARGIYEIQMIKTKTVFKDPLNPIKLLHYLGESEFPKPAPEWEKWYKAWRKEGSYDTFEDMVKRHGYDKKEDPEAPPIEPTEIQNAGRLLANARWNKG